MPEVISKEAETLTLQAMQRIVSVIRGQAKAEDMLKWFAEQDEKVIRETILGTQPTGPWRIIAEPLVESLNKEQRAAVLAALMAVFAQTLRG